MGASQERLKLGKGAAFVKSQMRHFRLGSDCWEADFRALSKPLMQTTTHFMGMVVTQPDGTLLADLPVKGTPTVNDLATLVAHAVRRPLPGGAHRPRRLLLRKNPRWSDLLPHLKELGVEVSLTDELPTIDEVFEDLLEEIAEAQGGAGLEPSAGQACVEHSFPAISKWVREYGHIEIGAQEGRGFVVQALDDGGLVFEDTKPGTLAEAMASLEEGLLRWFEEPAFELT